MITTPIHSAKAFAVKGKEKSYPLFLMMAKKQGGSRLIASIKLRNQEIMPK